MGEGSIAVKIPDFDIVLAIVSTVVAVAGIFLAYMMYYRQSWSAEAVGRRFSSVYTLLSAKYYFDELYEDLLVREFFYGGVARILDWGDKNIVHRIANMIGWFGANVGSMLRQFQTGQIQQYAAAISIGVTVILGLYIWFL